MQMTPSLWMRIGLGFVFSGFAGWFLGQSQGPKPGTPLLNLNEKAPLVTVAGQILTLESLNSEAKFELERISSQFILQAQNLALRQAALNDFAKNKGVQQRWRDVLAQELSEDNLRKTYAEQPSFKQAGSFSAQSNEVERYVLEQERNKKVGAFIEKNFSTGKIKFHQPAGMQVSFPFAIDNFPIISIGDSSLPRTPEVQMVFRYAGQVSNTAFAILTDASRENKHSIPVRLIPEWTKNAYDRGAIAYLFEVAKSRSPSEISKIHTLFLKNSPPLSELQNEAAVAGALDKVKRSLSEAGLPPPSIAKEAPPLENLPIVAQWYRDVRSNQLPLFFVDLSLVSETHPRGLDIALLEAMKL
ncbi:hypothetical protein EBU99_10190 [bacterium]|nr:hypothetical protein [bacterium]